MPISRLMLHKVTASFGATNRFIYRDEATQTYMWKTSDPTPAIPSLPSQLHTSVYSTISIKSLFLRYTEICGNIIIKSTCVPLRQNSVSFFFSPLLTVSPLLQCLKNDADSRLFRTVWMGRKMPTIHSSPSVDKFITFFLFFNISLSEYSWKKIINIEFLKD